MHGFCFVLRSLLYSLLSSVLCFILYFVLYWGGALQKEEHLHRVAVSIKFNRARPQLIVNSDQTGVLLGGGQKRTYEDRGAKDVPINGRGDKRQITAVLGVSFEPDILPL